MIFVFLFAKTAHKTLYLKGSESVQYANFYPVARAGFTILCINER